MIKNMKKIATLVIALVSFFLFPFSLFSMGSIGQQPAIAQEQSVEQAAKYVFLFIGDGMAMPQINATEAFLHALSSEEVAVKRLEFSSFPIIGLTTTHDAGSLITDSASAGTAMATGKKTLSGVINMNPGKTISYKPITEYAQEKGMSIGIVSSVSLDHATPASFYAKVPSRGDMYSIALQLVSSGFDYFGGGGFVQRTGRNRDQEDVLHIAENNGYTIINTPKEFRALQQGDQKIIAIHNVLQDSSAMPYAIDKDASDLSLADYTAKGIELLSGNPNGFFMMVESGKIDWAGHANDAGAVIHDVLAFDQAISHAIDFAAKHPQETLIVVTGDHETGGMTIGFAGTKYSTFYDKIINQKVSFTKFNQTILSPYKAAMKASGKTGSIEDILPMIESLFGIQFSSLTPIQQEDLRLAYQRSMGGEVIRPVIEDQYLLYGGYEPLTVKITQILNQQAGIGWTSYAHTGVPVATFAKGVGQELFGGYYDNTDIFYKLAQVMHISQVSK